MGLSGAPGAPAALLGARFRVQIEGLDESPACAVVLPQARAAPGRGVVKRVVYTELALRRMLGARADWYEWWARARQGGREARDVVISLLDAGGAVPLRWTMHKVRPSGYGVSDLDALQPAPLVETLALAVQDCDLQFAPPAPAGAVPRPVTRRRSRAGT